MVRPQFLLLRIEHVRRGVGDVRARAVDLGEVAHRIVGEGGAQIELARARVSHDRLRYVLVGRVVGGGVRHRAAGGVVSRTTVKSLPQTVVRPLFPSLAFFRCGRRKPCPVLPL